MTPQEKAKELFDKFYLVNSESVELETGEYDLVLSLDARDAKQCALIAVDEIMKAVGWEEMELGVDRDNYWQEVKKEIEKL
jgi:hypothetical protein